MSSDKQATLCEKCIFSHKANLGNKACDNNIIEQIKDNYSIIEDKSGFNIIKQYKCLYAFSREIHEKNIKKLGTVDDVRKQIITNNRIAYTLCIYVSDLTDKTLYQLKNIKKFSILPLHIVILGMDSDISILQNKLDNILPKDIPWKCHGYVIETDIYDMAQGALSTNNIAKSIPYIWFLDINDIGDMANKKAVELLNNLIFIQNLKSNTILLKSDKEKQSSDRFLGSFMSHYLWSVIRSYKENNVVTFDEIISYLPKEYPEMEIAEYAY